MQLSRFVEDIYDELLTVAARDYYDVLGVGRQAGDADVKKAFRRLARELHPDVNDHDPEAETKFKEAAEAYEVLSDPERRRAYDAYGHDGPARRRRRARLRRLRLGLGHLHRVLRRRSGFESAFGGASRRRRRGAGRRRRRWRWRSSSPRRRAGSPVEVAYDGDRALRRPATATAPSPARRS